MTLEFIDKDGHYIKQWPNWNGEIPQRHDSVILHFGDNNENLEFYYVDKRIIDGTKNDYVFIVVHKLDIECKNGKN